MNWDAVSFDWNQVRAFLATVEEGSLSAAARVLGQAQPTLSRQVAALERDLGVTLFERGPRAMALTEAGNELVDHVRAMGEAATRLSLSASGQSQIIEGHVSITATDMTATHLLPPVLMQLRDAAPNINVELIPSNDVRDLIKREADIAIRHVRPEQADLITKLIGSSSAQLYASQSFLACAGHPETVDDLSTLSFVGMSPIERFLPTVRASGLELKAEQFEVTTASGTALVELVRQGLGISIIPRYTAKLFPELVPVLQDRISFPMPIWLVTHRELHTSRRIRVVYDLLASSLAELL
ncbi:MAG: LysR family transcriptional regulator [Gammaproteobacteria bacterium]|nr:LysR family transcriptional regulator [Gammaproteobacteria bacterium]MDH3749711.1 LysR family transcriptional regulator [Gammaproteobacteria bacterium]MDH3805447.1 LysR family transcriptional regulator [Gammaproteobacteria bacterium]